MITILNTENIQPVVEDFQIPSYLYTSVRGIFLNSLDLDKRELIPSVLKPHYKLNYSAWLLHSDTDNRRFGSNGLVFSPLLTIMSSLLWNGAIGPSMEANLYEVNFESNSTIVNLVQNGSVPSVLLARTSLDLPGHGSSSELWGILISEFENTTLVIDFVNAMATKLNSQVREFGIVNPPQLPYLEIGYFAD